MSLQNLKEMFVNGFLNINEDLSKIKNISNQDDKLNNILKNFGYREKFKYFLIDRKKDEIKNETYYLAIDELLQKIDKYKEKDFDPKDSLYDGYYITNL